MKRPAHQIIWGYKDYILEIMNEMKDAFPEVFAKIPIPGPYISVQQNNSGNVSGSYSAIYTGKVCA